MPQKQSDRAVLNLAAQKGFENVGESWVLYDTILIGGYANSFNYHDGYYPSFATAGNVSSFPFFNVRNRNHGLAYNNQDTRDQLPWVFRIFSIGVSFWGPSTVLYRDTAGVPTGAQVTELQVWENEIPKHASLTLQIQQDERLKIASLMAPSGIGAVGGGVAQGDPENLANWAIPNVSKFNFGNGTPLLTNRWAFKNPLEVPRRANLQATINLSEYGRSLLADMTGPWYHPFQAAAAYTFKWGMCGMTVLLGGQRLVQQRGQYHA